MRRHLALIGACLLAALAAAVVMQPGLTAWFVADDFHHLAWVRMIPDPWTAWVHPQFDKLLYRPVTYVFNYYFNRLLGSDPLPVHAAGLVLHGINSALFIILVRAILERRRSRENPTDRRSSLVPAAAAGLVFAVHPLAALTANWYACRADHLAVLFGLGTLLTVAARPRPTRLSLGAAGLLAFLAMASKGPYMTLFPAGVILAFLVNDRRPARERIRHTLLHAVPLFAAFALYLSLRVLVIGRFGGYADQPSSVGSLLDQALFHLPLVFHRAARDFLFYHLARHDLYFAPTAALWIALAALGLPAALVRRKTELLTGLLLAAVLILPAWNLSHMLVFREDRLLYLPLAGFLLMAAGLADAPRSPALRALAAAVLVLLSLSLGAYSHDEIKDWRGLAHDNLVAAQGLASYVRMQADPEEVRRIYVLGLPADDYYLDAMVKLTLGAEPPDLEILDGERPSFLWVPARGETRPDEQIPEGALPRRVRLHSDPSIILESVTPPDLLTAVFFDPRARVVEVKGLAVNDLTQEIKGLSNLRKGMAGYARVHEYQLPSFSFVKSRVPFDWTPGPGVELVEPGEVGKARRLRCANADPYLVSPPLHFKSIIAARLVFEMEVAPLPRVPADRAQACLRWTGEGPDFPPANLACTAVIPDGKPHRYAIELYSNLHWLRAEKISRVRFDPVPFPAAFSISYLEFLPPESE